MDASTRTTERKIGMSDNEIIKEYPFEKETAYYKKEIQDFFSRYENKSGGEDCIEVCLIRDGYRMVLKAEEEMNRRDAEIERLQKENERFEKEFDSYYARVKSEARKELAERLKAEIDIRPTHSKEQNKYVFFLIDNLVKEMERENDK